MFIKDYFSNYLDYVKKYSVNNINKKYKKRLKLKRKIKSYNQTGGTKNLVERMEDIINKLKQTENTEELNRQLTKVVQDYEKLKTKISDMEQKEDDFLDNLFSKEFSNSLDVLTGSLINTNNYNDLKIQSREATIPSFVDPNELLSDNGLTESIKNLQQIMNTIITSQQNYLIALEQNEENIQNLKEQIEEQNQLFYTIYDDLMSKPNGKLYKLAITLRNSKLEIIGFIKGLNDDYTTFESSSSDDKFNVKLIEKKNFDGTYNKRIENQIFSFDESQGNIGAFCNENCREKLLELYEPNFESYQSGGNAEKDFEKLLLNLSDKNREVYTYIKQIYDDVEDFNLAFNNYLHHNVFLMAIISNQLIKIGSYVIYNFMNKGLVEFYFDIIEEMHLSLNSNQPIYSEFLRKYHTVTINRLYRFFQILLNKILIGTNESKIIDINNCGDWVRYHFTIFNHFRKIMEAYKSFEMKPITVYSRINDPKGEKFQKNMPQESERVFSSDYYLKKPNPDYKKMNINKGKCDGLKDKSGTGVDDGAHESLKFTRVFDSNKFEDLNEISNHMALQSRLISGQGTAILTYGYSGVGKTFTVFGKGGEGGSEGLLQSTLNGLSGLKEIHFRVFEFYGKGLPFSYYWDKNGQINEDIFKQIYFYRLSQTENQLNIEKILSSNDENFIGDEDELIRPPVPQTATKDVSQVVPQDPFTDNDNVDDINNNYLEIDPNFNEENIKNFINDFENIKTTINNFNYNPGSNNIDINTNTYIKIKGSDVKDIFKNFSSFITNIDNDRKYRRTSNLDKTIMETPNNPESSRSMMMYDFQLIIETVKDNRKEYLLVPFIIIDLPGREEIIETFVDNFLEKPLTQLALEEFVKEYKDNLNRNGFNKISSLIDIKYYENIIRLVLSGMVINPFIMSGIYIPHLNDNLKNQKINDKFIEISEDSIKKIFNKNFSSNINITGEQIYKIILRAFNNLDKKHRQNIIKNLKEDNTIIDSKKNKIKSYFNFNKNINNNFKFDENFLNNNYNIGTKTSRRSSHVYDFQQFGIIASEVLFKMMLDKNLTNKVDELFKKIANEIINKKIKTIIDEKINNKELDDIIVILKHYSDDSVGNKEEAIKMLKEKAIFRFTSSSYQGIFINENIIGLLKYLEDKSNSNNSMKIQENIDVSELKRECYKFISLNIEKSINIINNNIKNINPPQSNLVFDKIPNYNNLYLNSYYYYLLINNNNTLIMKDSNEYNNNNVFVQDSNAITYKEAIKKTVDRMILINKKHTINRNYIKNNANNPELNYHNLNLYFGYLEPVFSPKMNDIFKQHLIKYDSSKIFRFNEPLITNIMEPYLNVIKDYKIFYVFSNYNSQLKCKHQYKLLENTKGFIETIIRQDEK